MVVALLVTGCSKTTVSTSQAPASTTSSAPPAATGPIKLVFNNWFQPPGVTDFSLIFEQFGKDFEAATGGRYTVEVVHGGTLAGVPDAFDAVNNGIADMGVFVPQDTNAPVPMYNLFTLPWGTATCTQASLSQKAVWKKGYLDKDLNNVRLMFMFASTSQDDLLTADPVNSLAEMKGYKIGMGGGVRIDLYKSLGAVPVFSGPSDVYSMIQKGIVNGSFYSAWGVYMTHEDEYLHYLINACRFGRVSMPVGVNKDVYNKMPDDVKKILDNMDADDKYTRMCGDFMTKDYEKVLGQYLDSGDGKKIDWSADDIAKVNTAFSEIIQKVISDTAAQGLPAKAMVDDYYNALKANGVANPIIGYTP
jgi:TRAP-type C4-dicarboxylate transport system substrate-binding protein